MSRIDFNNLLNPVGSVKHVNEGNRKIDAREYDVSADNPAYQLIDSMVDSGKYNNDNMGDLYDKALQWEIDRATWIDQLTVDQAIKEEQREYDLPINEVARLRAAGINPDISNGNGGSLGSGSAGSVAGASTNDNQGSIGRTDNYAAQYYNLALAQTIANSVATAADTYATIQGAVDQHQMVQPNINAINANASLSLASAENVNTLTPLQAEAMMQQNIGLGLSNTSQSLQQMADMSKLINPDATDAEMNSFLRNLGISEENMQGAAAMIRQLQKNPELQNKYAVASLEARFSRERNQQYSQSLISQVTQNQIRFENISTMMSADRAELESSIVSYLKDSNYAQDTADLMQSEAQVGVQELELRKEKVRRDAEAHATRILQLSAEIESGNNRIDEIYTKALREGRGLTQVEKAMVKSITSYNNELAGLGAEELEMMYSIARKCDKLMFMNEAPKTKKGLPKLSKQEQWNVVADLVFDDNLSHQITPYDMVDRIFGRILDVAKSVN